MSERVPRAKAAEIEVGMEAGGELPGRLDQCHLYAAVVGNIFGDRRPTRTAADDDDLRSPLRKCRQREAARDRKRAGATQEFSAVDAWHDCPPRGYDHFACGCRLPKYAASAATSSAESRPAIVCMMTLSRFLSRNSSITSMNADSGQPTIGRMPSYCPVGW